MNRRLFLKNLALGTSGLLYLNPLEALAKPTGEVRQVRYVMGTLLDIRASGGQAEQFLSEAFKVTDKLNRLLSNYSPDSEISRLNQGHKLELSGETREVLALGAKYDKYSSGSFNIAVRPLVELWRNAAKENRFPKDKEIELAKQFSKLEALDTSGSKFFLSSQNASIETGGIGKGYALEKIKLLLSKYEVESALINFGHSSIYAHGTPTNQNAWRVALKFPNEKDIKGVFELKDEAASASSSFGDSALVQGKRHGHIIDPASGLPLTEKRLVALTSKSPVEAEVLSSEAVLDPSKLNTQKKNRFIETA